MALKNFHKVIAETSEEVDDFVEQSMDILDRIHELLEEKFNGRQKLLAEKLGKSEAEVSKMLNGVQNFTLKTINKLERAFGAKIIAVCTNELMADFIPVKTGIQKGYRQITVARHEIPEDEQFEGVAVKAVSLSKSNTNFSAS
jgi:transcriptional regulator with XRE-family HTH domain